VRDGVSVPSARTACNAQPACDISSQAACAGFARELLEEALGHRIGTVVERAYRQTDSFERRRKIMQA
jgi:hypothetical protein